MTHDHTELRIAPEALAGLGVGQVAYVRPLMSDDLPRIYPGAPTVPPGLRLWALVGAAGAPILIAGDLGAVIAGAREKDLVPLAVH